MKNIIFLITILFSSLSYGFDRENNYTLGIGYRMDLENQRNYSDDYQTAQNKEAKNTDTGSLFFKSYFFKTDLSESKYLWGGVGVNYQFNGYVDFSFSPVAYKDVHGLTFSIDTYIPDSKKGGIVGIGIGWSF